MSNLKEIRTRINSVKSTRQITSAMKMVSAAKLRKSQDAVIQLRPYAEKLKEVLSSMSESSEIQKEHVYTEIREIKKVLIVIVTSNKGLCGAFNANIVRTAIYLIHSKYESQFNEGNIDFYIIGKKGYDLLKSKSYSIFKTNTEIYDDLSFQNIAKFAEEIMQNFVNKQYDVVEIVYNQFKNAAVQIITTEQYLPVKPQDNLEEKILDSDFILEPSKEYIIKKLIPNLLRIEFYKCILDSNTSEHGARMTTMHQATDNATEIIKDLNLSYNKARQASITREIIEIVSGAEALKG